MYLRATIKQMSVIVSSNDQKGEGMPLVEITTTETKNMDPLPGEIDEIS